MTQDEAKKLWCPFARAVSGDNVAGGINRVANSGAADIDCRCLAGGCMAWRLISPLAPDDGYCGLAGHPVRFAAPHGSDDC